MKKYVLYIDYQRSCDFQYLDLEASDIADAMTKADAICRDSKRPVYLMRVMVEVKGSSEKLERGLNRKAFKAFICNRGNGWHPNSFDYSEGEHIVYKYTNRYTTWFDMA